MERDENYGSLRTQAETVTQDMRNLVATAGEAARRQLDPVAEYVQIHPVKSLLIAAGAGVLLSFLLGRR